MTEKRLYEVINPSDPITFRARPEMAALVSARLGESLLFVKDIETGEDPKIDNLQEFYESIWKDADLIAEYAEAYRSFLIGRPSDRKIFEEAVKRMTPEDAAEFTLTYHDQQRSSLNDICRSVWQTAERIAATEPEP